MSRDEFMTALMPLNLECLQDVVQKYDGFVTDNVDSEQFVDFNRIEDRDAAIDLWRDAIFGGLYAVKEAYGYEEAVRIAELSMEIDICFYPSEMLPVGEYIHNGGNVLLIPKLMEFGRFEANELFFPKAPPGADLGRKSRAILGKDTPSVLNALRQQEESEMSDPDEEQQHEPGNTVCAAGDEVMKRFHVLKDGMQMGSAVTRELAIDLIRQHQEAETHPILRPQFSIIEGEEEFVPYPSQRKPPKKNRGTER